MSSKAKRLRVPTIKPRNPYVAAALLRKAGLHARPFKAVRARDKVRLRQEQDND